jgi:hypothetical protein
MKKNWVALGGNRTYLDWNLNLGSYHVPAIVARLEKIYRSDTLSLLYIW